MVDKNNRRRRKNLWNLDASTLRQAETFVQNEPELQLQVKMRSRDGLTPKQMLRRGIRAMLFLRRLQASAKQKTTVDGVMLEVAEAVAKHWRDVRGYYCAVVVGNMAILFIFIPQVLRSRAMSQAMA
eukprot:COSAG05_NODE_314_length_11610_cov_17.223265_7_plen_127_part_00